jgi:hypothetical protein
VRLSDFGAGVMGANLIAIGVAIDCRLRKSHDRLY